VGTINKITMNICKNTYKIVGLESSLYNVYIKLWYWPFNKQIGANLNIDEVVKVIEIDQQIRANRG